MSFDDVYAVLAQSLAYRDAVRSVAGDMPDWLVPYSVTGLEEMARIADRLAIGPGDSFADIGCGLGGIALWIAQRTGAAVTGVDASPEAIAGARELAGVSGVTSAQFIVADACSTGLPDGLFDALMSIDSLQFIDAPAAIAEMARLLRPGGVGYLRAWEKIIEPFPLPTVVADYRPIFENNGFTIVSREEIAFRELQTAFSRAVLARGDALRAELGETAEALLEEAREDLMRAVQPPRVRKVALVVNKRRRTKH